MDETTTANAAEADDDDVVDLDENLDPVRLVLGLTAAPAHDVTVVAGDQPLPAPLNDRLFWDAYVWSGKGGRPDDFGRYRIDLRVSDSRALLVEAWFEDYLYLLHPDLPEPQLSDLHEPGFLGWLNDYHDWYPYALQWEELEAMSARVSLRSGLPHPGIPLLLLAGFSWPDPDQRPGAFIALRRAFETLGLYDAGEIDAMIDRYGFRDEFTGVGWHGSSGGPFVEHQFTYTIDRRWERDGRLGWVMEGDTGYSLRHRGNDRFPFIQLDDLINAARVP